MGELLNRLLNGVRNFLSFGDDPRYKQNFDWYPTQGGGGGGDVTKAYVDAADNNLQTQIDTKVGKDTGTGQKVYTSNNGATTMKNIATEIDDSTESIPINKAVKDYTDSKVKYIHTMVRYNDDNKYYPMGWWKYIDNKETVTLQDFKDFLKNNGYTSKERSWYWAGGCCGTTGVRNAADSGTAYVGKMVSGVYYVEDEDSIYFKGDYNASTSILYSRINLYTEQI